jgi:Tfp pilus assembly protein PilF
MEKAKRLNIKAIDYFRKCGDNWGLGLALGFSPWVEISAGNFAKAKILAEEARDIRQALGHTHSVIDSIDVLVEIAINQGEKEEARRLCSSALEIAEDLGNVEFINEYKAKLIELGG